MMKYFEELNEENFESFAIRHYDNPQCLTLDEFKEDLDRFKWLKRLFRRTTDGGDLKERLILNHLIAIYNVFDIKAANKMIFYRVDSESRPQLKAFLTYLRYLPEGMYSEIVMDLGVAKKLKDI